MSESETTIPVVEETFSIETRAVPKARVRVETKTDVVEELVRAQLASTSIHIAHVPIGREIDRTPEIRTEDGVTIIPVIEEILVIEKRLVLKEELHVRRLSTNETMAVPITLRKQRAIITRLEINPLNNPERSLHMANEYSATTEQYANRTLTALFDDRDDAEEAVARLRDLGIVETSIRLVGGDEYRTPNRSYDKGFWAGLADFFFPDDDRAFYEEGLRRGGYMVTVNNIRSDHYDEALDILDDEGSVDLDERQSTWRSEGWSGSASGLDFMPVPGDAGVAPVSAGTGCTTLGSDTDLLPNSDLAADTDMSATRMRDFSTQESDENVIPVIEEELRVGKRNVDLGRVRVRSYVVEEPVSEDVTLREDRVTIERRPVDRALGADESAFADKTIEAMEHAEEAIISKNARVKEEIALRRDSSERTETVSDTIRHTEVEVEDERTSRTGKTTRRNT